MKPYGFDSYWLDKIGLLQEGDTWHSALGSTKIAITHDDIQYVHQLQHRSLRSRNQSRNGGVSMLREDIRGICHRPCIYNDKGKCDMWDELSVPDETEECAGCLT